MGECTVTKTELSKHRSYKQAKWESLQEHLQVKLLFPYRVQIPKNCFCPLLRFTHLNSYIWIAGPSLVFGLQTLSTHHWKGKEKGYHCHVIRQCTPTSCEAAAQNGQRNRDIAHKSLPPQLVVHYSAWSRIFSTCYMHTKQKETQVRGALALHPI